MSHKRFKMFQQRAERDSHCMFLWSTCSQRFCVEKSSARERRPAKRLLCICARKKTCRTGNSIWIQHSAWEREREASLLFSLLTRAQSSLANLPISWASIRWLIFSSLQMSLGDNGCGIYALRTTIAQRVWKSAVASADPREPPPAPCSHLNGKLLPQEFIGTPRAAIKAVGRKRPNSVHALLFNWQVGMEYKKKSAHTIANSQMT